MGGFGEGPEGESRGGGGNRGWGPSRQQMFVAEMAGGVGLECSHGGSEQRLKRARRGHDLKVDMRMEFGELGAIW